MDEVAPLIGDVFMEQAVFPDHFLVVLGTRLHPAQPPLHPGQLFLGLLQPVEYFSPMVVSAVGITGSARRALCS